MAIFRNVNMSFWTDPKVVDDYTPEDKYFMLYALTNNYTNIIGCYEISVKQMSNDLGYTKDVVENLLKRFKEIHKTLDYDFETKELMVVNWYKYNWSSSPKLDSPLYTAIEKVKSDLFHDKLATIYNNRETVIKSENNEENDLKDRVSIPYRYGIDTTITITNTIPISIPISNSITNNSSITKEERKKKEEEEKKIEEQLKIEFESIWSKYPNKQGKSSALKSYMKARIKENINYEDVVEGLKRYLVYCKQNKDWYSPKNGSTWFNQHSWNDEYPLKKVTTKDLAPMMNFDKFRQEV